MELAQLTAHNLKELLDKREISNREIILSVLDVIDKKESMINAFITIKKGDELLNEADKIDQKRLKGDQIGELAGLPIAVKDNICTKDLLTTCASKILSNYVPPYDATVIKHIYEADGIIIGKTNMDEFSMGSSTENSAFKITRNPHNLDYVPGGTSGGSAASVSANETILALGADTGGSVRQPASYCGTVGIKPTYGRISRFGLIAYGSSLDQVGVLAKDVQDAALLLKIISGYDPLDSTSYNKEVPNYFTMLTNNIPLRIGVPTEYFKEGLDCEVKEKIFSCISLLEKDGHEIVNITLPHSDYGIAAYYIIACCEASSNLSRYAGLFYGSRASCNTIDEMYFNSRSRGFGEEVKRRIILGTYALRAGYYDQFYTKATKVRTLIKRDFENAFKLCDIIVGPVVPEPAFKIGEKKSLDPLTMYLVDLYSVIANLAGLPAISIPCGFSSLGLPISVQLTGSYFSELDLLSLAYRLEQLLNNNN